MEELRSSGLKPTRGDARCTAYGHMIRLAIWNLKNSWVKGQPVEEKIRFVAQAVQSLGDASGVEQHLPDNLSRLAGNQSPMVREADPLYGPNADEIPF